MDVSDEVQWMFKWSEDPEAEVHGPASTKSMKDWMDAGYFEKTVFVRQVGKEDGPYYKSSRIDFELYL